MACCYLPRQFVQRTNQRKKFFHNSSNKPIETITPTPNWFSSIDPFLFSSLPPSIDNTMVNCNKTGFRMQHVSFDNSRSLRHSFCLFLLFSYSTHQDQQPDQPNRPPDQLVDQPSVQPHNTQCVVSVCSKRPTVECWRCNSSVCSRHIQHVRCSNCNIVHRCCSRCLRDSICRACQNWVGQ